VFAPVRITALLVRHRLVCLGLLGMLLTVLVTGTALASLAVLQEANRELEQVSRAQRLHQDADMMHDALRADVARAQQTAMGQPGLEARVVRAETEAHAAQFRDDLRQLAVLELPSELDRTLDRLRPRQQLYITRAEQVVQAALDGDPSALEEQASYQEAFRRLAHAQAAVTETMAATAQRTERSARKAQGRATRILVVASLAALGGWAVATFLLGRSKANLGQALLREAEQRSAVDLLQRSLMPKRLPAFPGVQLAARSIPGTSGLHVGGDWHDVIALPSGELGLVVGDVMGHDLAAATVMGQLRNTLRAYALEDASPAGVLSRVNRAADLLDLADMATCLYAVFDPCSRKVRWCSAGHLPPLVTPAERPGRLFRVDPGPPLGTTCTAEYEDHEFELQPGETLVLYTDGLVERRGATIDAGLSRLETVRAEPADADAVCDRLLATLHSHGGRRDDDVTLLVLHLSDHVAAQAAAVSA
jgi:serine phosphatase RsbU (regulator of sigma subunit)